MKRSAFLSLLVLLALAAVPAAASAQKVRPANDNSPLGDERLSNERTVSRWAHPYSRARIRKAPRLSASTAGRLHLQTEDGVQEVYLVLRSKLDSRDRVWLQIRMLGRGNNHRTGWVLEESLGPLNVVTTQLRINRTTLTATLYKRGRKVWASRVGVGKASTPTPRGRFYVREKLRSLGGAYGPWAFGTSAYSKLSDWPGGGVVGVHGTNQPHLIPGRPSHGCIRVPNDKISQLARIMPIGTPIRIL